MSIAQQNGSILPEYAVDNLGTSFKVILVGSAQCCQGENGREIYIPDYQGLIKKIAVSRAAHPMKLKGDDIRFLRKNLGLRGKELAEKLDITPEHLSRCESGDKTLSSNSEKVLRTLVLLEAVYVLKKAIDDNPEARPKMSERISQLLDSLKDIVSGLKISPVHSADEELVFHFKLAGGENQVRSVPANDHEAAKPGEWLDDVA